MSFNEAARQRAHAKLAALESDPAYANHQAWGTDRTTLAQQLRVRLSGQKKSRPQ